MYRVKEAFYTLQGEGAHSGRAAVFCRFSKCNLWNGREQDRLRSVCQFCDTDFVGTDGQNGGEFNSAEDLASHLNGLWRGGPGGKPYVVCTGGEPLLQLDHELIEALHLSGFEVGVETNGTLPAPAGIDWLCVSPKADAKVVISECDELKLVYPQELAPPTAFDHIVARHYWLSPMASPVKPANGQPDLQGMENTRAAIQYCMTHPRWRLTVQMHKMVGID